MSVDPKMAKSNAEWSKLMRERQKVDTEKCSEILEHDRKRKRVLQEKQKNTLTSAEKEKLHQKRRDDQRKYLARKKAAEKSSTPTPNQEKTLSNFREVTSDF